jgi:hypothetical protein
MRFPPERALSGLPERQAIKGEVMEPTVLTVRKWHDGSWRVFAHAPDLTARQMASPVSDRAAGRRILGGTFQQACTDADRVARENGFIFQRPNERQLP